MGLFLFVKSLNSTVKLGSERPDKTARPFHEPKCVLPLTGAEHPRRPRLQCILAFRRKPERETERPNCKSRQAGSPE